MSENNGHIATCASCDFFIETGKANGECRRYPPTAFMLKFQAQADPVEARSRVIPGVGMVQAPAKPERVAGFGASYPPIRPEMIACGEYRAKPSGLVS